MKTLKATTSVCPECIKTIPAKVIRKEKGIYIQKECKIHGKFSYKISDEPEFYSTLYNSFTQLVKPDNRKITQYYLFISYKCNMNCPICYISANEHDKEPTAEQIMRRIKDIKQKHVSLMGGEPTIREDIFEIIKSLSKRHNVVSLYTNGIKIAKEDYLKALVDAGLNDVRLQFDGFNDEVYNELRSIKLSNLKKDALDNLIKFKMPTILEYVVTRDLNLKYMAETIEFARIHPVIKAIGFNSYRNYGRGHRGNKSSVLSSEMIKQLEKDTGGLINMTDVIAFNKILYFMSNIGMIPIRSCFNHLYLPLFRKGNKFTNLTKFINSEKIIGMIDNYQKTRKGKLTIMLYLSRLLNGAMSPEIIKLMLLGKINEAKINNLTLLQFVNPCDKYTYIGESAKYCFGREIHPGIDKDVAYSGLKNIEREKKFVS